MKFCFTITIGILCSLLTFSQSLSIENSFSSNITSKGINGINAPYLFSHLLDDNYEVIESLREEIYNTNYDLIRFPGGTIGNYYRYSLQGYGLLKSEVNSIVNGFNCAGSYWCLSQDENATRNYIHDLVDFAEHKYNATGKKTQLLFVMSVLLHWYYNVDEIELLADIQNLNELNTAVSNGIISQDFQTRIMENHDAFQLLHDNEYIDVVGLEFGNELYFYQEITDVLISLNSDPFFNLNNSLAAMTPRIEKLVTLLNFYRRILTPIDPNVKIGMPVGGINHLGNPTNINRVWNTAIKNLAMDHVDALIHHTYVSIDDNYNGNPLNIANDDDNNVLKRMKESVDLFISDRYDRTVEQFDLFFDIKNLEKDVWFTEWNANKAQGNGTIWDEWGNTLFHGIFLNRWIEQINTATHSGRSITYNMLHGWTSSDAEFIHNMLAITNDETVIKRISYYVNEVADFFKSEHVRSLYSTSVSSQPSSEFYSKAYYSYDRDASDDCPEEKLHITFANLRADEITTDFNFTNNKIWIDNIEYKVESGKLIGYKGNNLASSCGRTDFDASEVNYDISSIDQSVTIGATQTIEGYSAGVFEFTIKPVIYNCIPLNTELNFNGSNLNLSPNPASNIITIQLNNLDASVFNKDLVIVNALGQLVETIKVKDQMLKLDVSTYQKGIYYISTLDFDDKKMVGTFVKQ